MNERKEVRFDMYCPDCKHLKKHEEEEPCRECLNQPWNIDSQRPIRFEKKKFKEKGAKVDGR